MSEQTDAQQNPLDPKLKAVAEAYLRCWHKTEAVRRARPDLRRPHQAAYRIFNDPLFKSYLDARIIERLDEYDADPKDVLREWVAHIKASAADVMEHRRNACRYCYGDGHRYQETPEERRQRERKHQHECDVAELTGEEPPPFDPLGGVGYDKRREPHTDCPECHGDGLAEIHVKDTRHMPAHLERAFGGVKTTAGGGLEVKLHSKERALENLARHLGMLDDRLSLSGPDGKPLNTGVVFLPQKETTRQDDGEDLDDIL